MKIVITGATGHIGSALIRQFAFDFPGAEIVLLDNMKTQRYCSLFNLPRTAKYSFVEMDVCVADLSKFFRDSDAVVHLAALTDAANSFENSDLVEKNNLEATSRVAKACLESRSQMILLSSTSVYGTSSTTVSEDCLLTDLNPQSPYAVTKLKEENLVETMVRDQGLRAVICRFGTIVGTSPGMRFHTAVNKFCWQAALGLPITVWKTAYDQKRPYLDLRDATRALSFIIKKQSSDGLIYNVLSSNSTVREITEIIRKFVPDIEINFIDNMIMNQLSYEVSNQRFSDLGFSFSDGLNVSVGETINLLKDARSFHCG
jgi:UDP-glucose 4-epimerase